MFVTNQPAMVIENKGMIYLLIGDLHLGLTAEFRRKGISVNSQITNFIDRIKNLKKSTRAKNLIMIGDVKHKPQGISWQEEKEIPMFLNQLSNMFKKIIIVKGNHDGNIERLVPHKDIIKVKNSIVIGDYFITHGHRKITTKKPYVIIAHNQPGIKFRDKIGAVYTLPCWVRGQLNKAEVIIMPAFNPLSGSTIVNHDKMLGPVAKNLNKSNVHVFLLDGTDIGTIKDLWIES